MYYFIRWEKIKRMIFLWFKGSSGRIIQISLTNLTKILNSYEVIKRVLNIGQEVV